MSRVRIWGAVLLLLLFTYYQVYRWIPLGKWNWAFSFPVENDQFYPDIVIGALLLLFSIAFAKRWRRMMYLGAALLSLWSVLHILDWWLPYAMNRPENLGRYRFYAPHTQLLPMIGHHYPPDAGHAVLDFLLFPTWIFAIAVSYREFLERRRFRKKAMTA